MPTTRTTRTRATAAAPVRKPRAPRVAEPEPELELDGAEVTDVDAQEQDAEPQHYVTASLSGEPIRVIPPTAWRLSWNRMLREENIDGVMEKVIHPDDLDFVLDELDPTAGELTQFLQDAGALSGEPMGKSRGPRGSSRSTRRR